MSHYDLARVPYSDSAIGTPDEELAWPSALTGCTEPLESRVLATHPQVDGLELNPSGSTRPQVDVPQDRSAVAPRFAGSTRRDEPPARTYASDHRLNSDNVLLRHLRSGMGSWLDSVASPYPWHTSCIPFRMVRL